MRKKINVSDVRLGMFIEELCGNWMDHPFWRRSFVLDQEKDLQTLKACGIQQLWINTGKGLDVEAGITAAEEAEDIPASDQPVFSAPSPVVTEQRVSMADELKRAQRIVDKSKEAVSSMFQEARMGKALDAEDALPLVEEIASSMARNPGALISLARLKNKDEYTYMHSVAVCALMVSLARQLKLDEQQTRLAGLAGLIHDVGKMMIPEEVLNKPGKLTDEEFALVKTHPAEGHKLLLEGKHVPETSLDVCLHHHEKMDGSGYPKRLVGEQISLFSRMGAICDVYDAITSNRPYKAGWDPAESLRKMAEWKGHFDEKIFQAFVKSLGIYPVGSLVRLESGRLGVVLEQSEKSLLTPRLRVFFSTKSGTYLPPEIVDLARPGNKEKIVAREDAEKWGIKNVNEMWLGADQG